MDEWTAIVPLKAGPERKTRLAPRLTGEARAALADRMAAHVVACLRAVPSLGTVRLLSQVARPEIEAGWEPDLGNGLNAELDRVRIGLGGSPMLVIHADLPLLSGDDVRALLAAAGAHGAAIAPDRHGAGTNALALARAPAFAFAFGEDSFARHRQALGAVAVIRRPGLSLDVDTPGDLDEALRHGFRPAD